MYILLLALIFLHFDAILDSIMTTKDPWYLWPVWLQKWQQCCIV